MSLEAHFPSFIRKSLRSNLLIGGLLLIAVPLVFQLMLIGFMTESVKQQYLADESVAHIQQAMEQAQRLLPHLDDMESACRGIVLTDDAIFTKSFDRAERELHQSLNVLKALVNDSPKTLTAMKLIAINSVRWLEFHLETVRLARAGDRDEAIARITDRTGQEQFEIIRLEVEAFQHELEQLADERSRLRVRQATSSLPAFMIGLGVSQLTVAIAIAFLQGIRKRSIGSNVDAQNPVSQTDVPRFIGLSGDTDLLEEDFREFAQTPARPNEKLTLYGSVLKLMLDDMSDGIVVVDETGQFLIFNRGAKRIMGIGPTDGDPCDWPVKYGIYHPDQKTLYAPEQLPITRAMRGENVDAEEVFVKNQVISEGKWITVTARPVKDACGVARGSVAVLQDVTHRKNGERELQRAMQLLDGTRDAIFIFNPETLRFSYVNQGAVEQVGYSRDELRNMTPLDIKPEFDESKFRQILGPLLSGAQSSMTFSTVHRHKQGECIPVEVSLQCSVDTANSQSLVAVVRDVTKRVKAEQERDRFFSLSLDMLCISDADGYFKRISPAFSLTLGWSEEELLSKPFMEFVHPEDRVTTLREVERQTVEGESVFNFENRYLHKDGSWRVLSWRSVPQPGGLMYATARDVTDSKRAEDSLRRSEHKLAIILDSIGDAVIAMDAAHHITHMNPIAEQLTGWGQSEAVGRPIEVVFLIVDNETRQPASEPSDDRQASGIIYGQSQYTVLMSRDGTRLPIDVSSAPMIGKAGQFTGSVLVFRDVSKERQQKERILRLNTELEHRVRQRTQELTESERFCQATLDSLSAHVAVLDSTGMIVATNQSWREFAQANNTTWQTVSEGTNYIAICDRAVGDADATATAHAIRQVLAGENESWSLEYPCHSADQQRWFYCRVTRFPGEGAVYVVVTHENITGMKQAQLQLAADRARFETLDRVSPVAILFFDGTGKCSDVNDRWCEMAGINRGDVTDDHWTSTVHELDRTRVIVEWSIAVREGSTSHSEHRLQRPNGEILWVVSQGVPIRKANGLVDGFIQVCTDVTEQKRVELALRLLSTDFAMLQGPAFYESVVRHLAELLCCEMAFICMNDPTLPGQLVTLAMFADSEFVPNFSYPSAGTPCENVTDHRSCVISSGARQKYPQDVILVDHQIESYAGVPFIDGHGRQIGHIGIMSRQPMKSPGRVESMINLFAVSVVSQLERQASEQRFSDLFEFSPDAVLITNRAGLIVQANRQVEAVFGWTPNELIGQPVDSLLPLYLRADHATLREGYMQSDAPRAMGSGRNDLLGVRKSGHEFPIDISLSPMQSPEGLLVATAVRDVTERQSILRDLQSVANELQEAEAFATTIIENVSGLFYVLDQDGLYVRWNQSLQDMLGYSSEQMLRTNGLSVVHEADQERIAGKMVEIFQLGHAQTSEARLLLKDGIRHFLLNGRRLEIHGKVYLVGSGADITDRKRSETEILSLNQTLEQRVIDRTHELTVTNDQLTQASRFKSEFLAAMSHELRTPLNGVLGMNELLLKTPLTDDQRRFIDASITSGKSLLSLINNVLDISKIEAGKIELDIGVCDLEALAEDIMKTFIHRAMQKGLSLSYCLAPDACVRALCDDNRLRQVLVNLLENALKFTASGSVLLELTCLLRREQQIVIQLAVTDTGLGIPDDKLSRLFSPFSQVDRSTSRHYGGTGLGLSITKQLVELMGGTIGVKSQVGVGSTFWAKIPFELVKEEVSVAQGRQLLQGISVLAVAGADRKGRQVANCLESWGCPYLLAATLRDAVDAVSQSVADGKPFAVILVECRLAIGEEFAQIQSLALRHNVPIIGLGDDEENLPAQHLDLRQILCGPVRPSVLYNSLASVLSVTPATTATSPKSEIVADKPSTRFSGRILVAEDNKINQMFLLELLKHSGCTCDIANNGDEALIALQSNRYDLVLMDCQMPELDGFTATREIRRLEAAGKLPGHVPIIALTANALKGDREKCLSAGMDDHLSKPLQSARLHSILVRYLTTPPTEPAR